MEKSKKILLLSNIVLIGFVTAIFFHYILGFYLKFKWPVNTFTYAPIMHFSDFTDMVVLAKSLMPYKTPDVWIVYLPLAYLFSYLFSFFKNPLVSYLIFASSFLIFLFYMNSKNFSCNNLTKNQNIQNIFILSLTSYPVLFILDRGNLDMLIFILFVLFIYCFKAQKNLLSALFLAIINAIKPIFLIYFVLFLFKKKWKECLLSFLLTIIMVIGGFMILKGDFFQQLSTLILNLKLYNTFFVYSNSNRIGTIGCSSLYMMLKLIFIRMPFFPHITSKILLNFYAPLSLIITSISIFFAWKEKSFWKQIALLTFCPILLPHLSMDYKLIFLFIPLWFFVNAKTSSKFDLIYTLLFGLLLIPKNIIIMLTSLTKINWFSFSVIANPIIIMVFMGLIIYDQISSPQK